ncbi:hypothetical protein JG687_00007572 [Phytophthora cactorum]|uniref:Secreted protein n=1 Tax=Phytophthora cactorum TaxID=29920 RepID=A0A329S266_9STRA|nr:hypothetical protein Pcac1_g18280 [Phytophthora cactorum]KAG2838538.1 hypothetical protein PC111_g4208 [Phytophthora cactorum]KAG2844215.1 hypothetical protein PC112_g2293 [Phytophthora cactorum]KAG2864188.1 hypothetical protein PC113_g4796 [Phytophthora cactorum]KAG2919766.1 hypothetical protein PC114_g6363 [Phytophthora cactorum]
MVCYSCAYLVAGLLLDFTIGTDTEVSGWHQTRALCEHGDDGGDLKEDALPPEDTDCASAADRNGKCTRRYRASEKS